MFGPDESKFQEALAQREEEIRDLHSRLRAMQEAAGGQEGLAQALQSAKTSAEEVSRLRALVAELQQQLAAAKEGAPAGAAELAQQQAQLQAQAQQLQAYKEQLQTQFAEQQGQLQSQAQQLTAYKEQLQKQLTEQHAKLQEKEQQLVAREQQLQGSNAESQEEQQKLQAELADHQSRLQAQEKQLQIYKQENDRQAAELASTAMSHTVEMARLQASLTSMTDRASTHEGRVKQLEEELAQAAAAPPPQQEEDQGGLAEKERLLSQREAQLASQAEALAVEREKLALSRKEVLSEQAENTLLEQRLAAAKQEAQEEEKRLQVVQHEALEQQKKAQEALDVLEEQKRLLASREELLAEREGAKSSPPSTPSEGSTTADANELARLKVELQVKSKEAKTARTELLESRRSVQELAAKAQRLEAQLAKAHHDEHEAEQKMATLVAKGTTFGLMGNNSSGGVGGAIAAVLQDVEMGQQKGVTLQDLGLSELTGLPPLDNFLQLLSALMTVRADARLAVFGVWVLCHMIYVIYLIYEHFVKR